MDTTTRQRRLGLGGLLTLAMVAVIALAHPAATMAQDTGDDEIEIADLPGVQAAVSRTFMIDFAAMFSMEASPTPETSGTQLIALGGTIVQFDSDDHAKDAYTTILTEIQKPVDLATPDAVTFTTVDLGGDLGDERTGLRITGDESDSLGGDVVALVVRDGSLIYLITGIAESGDPSDAVVAFTKAVMGGKAGGGEATFNEDGTSTGGLWDKFPAPDDPAVAGLPSVLDADPMTDDSGE
ncbi:MAG: hypothetical protein QM753_10765 [Thermomicrobiales bacterium]